MDLIVTTGGTGSDEFIFENQLCVSEPGSGAANTANMYFDDKQDTSTEKCSKYKDFLAYGVFLPASTAGIDLYADTNGDGSVTVADVTWNVASGTTDANGFIAFTGTKRAVAGHSGPGAPSIATYLYPGGGSTYKVGVGDGVIYTSATDSKLTIKPHVGTPSGAVRFDGGQKAVTPGQGIDQANEAFTIVAQGFAASETVSFSLGGKMLTPTSATTDAQGRIGAAGAVTFQVPDVAGGSQTLQLSGAGGSDDVATTSLLVTPTLSLGTTTTVAIGGNVNLAGRGFEQGSYVVVIGAAEGSVQVAGPVTVGSNGKLTVGCNIPDYRGGVALFDICDADDTTTSVWYGKSVWRGHPTLTTSPVTNIGVDPSVPEFNNVDTGARGGTQSPISIGGRLLLTPTSGFPNDTISVEGEGLRPNDDYTLFWDAEGTTIAAAQALAITPTSGSATTDGDGNFQCDVLLPPSSGGFAGTARTLWAGRNSATATADVDAQANFAVITHMTASPVSGGPSEIVALDPQGCPAQTTLQVWWYAPTDVVTTGNVPAGALPLATFKAGSDGAPETPVHITIPANAQTGQTYVIDMTGLGTLTPTLSVPIVFTVQDITAPSLTHTPPAVGTEQSPLPISVDVTDPSGVDRAECYWRMGAAGDFTKVDMTAQSSTYSCTVTPPEAGTLQYYLMVWDTSGNYGRSPETGEHSITIEGLYPLSSSAPAIKDETGSVVTPSAGEMVLISTTITNTRTTDEPTLYIAQVKDSSGTVVSLVYLMGVIPAGASFEFGIPWTPSASGTYTVEIFAWTSWTDPTPLSEAVTTTVVVT
jgi:hypothetical protein